MSGKEEQEMYLTLLRKTLSGSLGRNLIDIPFETKQVAGSDEHRLLQALRESACADENARHELYSRVISSLDMQGENYLILLAGDAYDVPHRGADGEKDELSDEVFRFFVCTVCPVKDATAALRYFSEERAFHGTSTGQTIIFWPSPSRPRRLAFCSRRSMTAARTFMTRSTTAMIPRRSIPS